MKFVLNKKIIKTIPLIALSLSLVVGNLAVPRSAEAGATLYFSPSSASPKVGETFTVTVFVKTDVSVNTVDTIITFPAGKLQAMSTSGGSPFNDFGFAPAIDNSSGTVRFLRAAFGGYKGNGGNIGGITFKAISAGGGSLGFGVSTVGANDGQATNVYSGGGSASISVKSSGGSSTPPPKTSAPAPPPSTSSPATQPQAPTGTATPVISSTSHPDQGKWYKEKEIAYAWSGSAEGYNFSIDQSATTQLPTQVKSQAKTASQTLAGDGVWYAHVRAKGANGWSNTAHYKIQVDASAPTELSLSTRPESPMTVLPTFDLSAKDAASGVAKYELKIDDGDWQEVKNGHKPKQLSSGEHTTVLRVTDKAGNSAEVETSFAIVPLSVPEMHSPAPGLIMLGEDFKVSGKTVAGLTVEIYINNELKETVVADDEGNYSSEEEYLLFPGSYEVTVKAVNKDGITSPMSEPVTVTIDAQAVSVMGLVLPGWGVFGAMGTVLAGLITGIVWLSYRMWRQTRMWAARWRRTNKSIEKELAELEQDLGARIDSEVGKVNPAAAEAIKSAIEEEFNKAEKDIDQSLAKVTGGEAKEKTTGSQTLVESIKLKLAGLVGSVAAMKGLLKLKARSGEGVSTSVETSPEPTEKVAEKDEVAADRVAEGEDEAVSEEAKSEAELSEESKKALDALAEKAKSQQVVEPESADHSVKPKVSIPEIADILAPEAADESPVEPKPGPAIAPTVEPKVVDDVPGDALSAVRERE